MPARHPPLPSPSPLPPAPHEPLDDLYAFTWEQVGQRIGLSESTVRRMAQAGQLRYVLLWGKPRVLPSDLRAYLERAQRQGRRPGSRLPPP